MNGNPIFGKIPQLRIAVNSRCGRMCVYCRPSGEGLAALATAQLTLDSVVDLAREFADLGGEEIKITGGDPALWSPLVEAVSEIKKIPHIRSIDVISRHPRIGALAPDLARAGVSLLNLSIDTLDPKKHKLTTGVDDLPLVLEALDKCVKTGIPCKVNAVVMKGINDTEIFDFAAVLAASGVHSLKLLDVIHDLDSGEESFAKRLAIQGKTLRDLYIPLRTYKDIFRPITVSVRTLMQGQLGHPMTELKLTNGLSVIIKDYTAGAWYGAMCQGCHHYPCHDALMAIRMTADGRLQPCLLNAEAAVSIGSGNGELRQKLTEMLGGFDSATYVSNGSVA